VRARDEFVGMVALQLHAKHARQRVRLSAKRDGGHSFCALCATVRVTHANIDSIFSYRPLHSHRDPYASRGHSQQRIYHTQFPSSICFSTGFARGV